MPIVLSLLKSLTYYLRLLTASILTSFSKSLKSVEKIEKRGFSHMSGPKASAKSAKFFARCNLTFQLLSPVN